MRRLWIDFNEVTGHFCTDVTTMFNPHLRTVLVVYLSVPFLPKSSYTLLRIMLETVCIPPLTSLICEIKTRGLILWKYQVILVIEYVFIIKSINYALWHTFESKRYMYFHNKTWYTCTRCYMLSPLVELSWIGCLTSQLTIFQSYMWRHIDVQADWRRSWTYGRAPTP